MMKVVSLSGPEGRARCEREPDSSSSSSVVLLLSLSLAFGLSSLPALGGGHNDKRTKKMIRQKNKTTKTFPFATQKLFFKNERGEREKTKTKNCRLLFCCFFVVPLSPVWRRAPYC